MLEVHTRHKKHDITALQVSYEGKSTYHIEHSISSQITLDDIRYIMTSSTVHTAATPRLPLPPLAAVRCRASTTCDSQK